MHTTCGRRYDESYMISKFALVSSGLGYCTVA